ncbi:putative secreted protein containing a PDZ domain [Actinobacteria bacterium IMCC26256]|nr:putative secreted protein containing a PDZ domain [Actinobacteria bacterium IMCC26256]
MLGFNFRAMICKLMEPPSEIPAESDATPVAGSISAPEIDDSWPLPPNREYSIAPRPRRKAARVLAICGFLLIPLTLVVLFLGTVIRLPYVIFSPGSATPVAPIVEIKGARTFPTRSDLLFLTVSVSNQRPNIWRYIQASLSSENTVVEEVKYLGGSTPKQDLAVNQMLMTESQEDAKAAALRYLGYVVPVTGSGAIVAAVTPGSPSEGNLRVGDLITRINSTPIQRAEEVGEAVRALPAGTEFVFQVTRRINKGSATSATREIEVKVESRLAKKGELKGKPFIGIAPATKNLKYEFPVDISIDPGPVSGPSAGLSFALAILDKMTPGSLPGRRDVAVTGTISADGVVGAVGGVRQKSVAACSAGAHLMMVPAGEEREASGLKCKGMRILGVESLEDALIVLSHNGGGSIPPRAVLDPAL